MFKFLRKNILNASWIDRSAQRMWSVVEISCVCGVFVLRTEPEDSQEPSASTRVTAVLNTAAPFTKVMCFLFRLL